jgi:hypothetical protein
VREVPIERDCHKDRVKARTLQKLFAAKKANVGALLDDEEYQAFQAMLDDGEFDWSKDCWSKRVGGCSKPADPVNHPSHYQLTVKGVQIEALDVISGLGLGFNLGNAVKYVWRHKGKGGIEDLRKARFYLDAEIAAWEAKRNEP